VVEHRLHERRREAERGEWRARNGFRDGRERRLAANVLRWVTARELCLALFGPARLVLRMPGVRRRASLIVLRALLRALRRAI